MYLEVFVLFLGFLDFSSAARSADAVRCYVCRSSVNQPKPIRFATNCSDIYDTTTTTIKYCRACLYYVGALRAGNVTFATPTKPAHIRTCYDESVFNVAKKDGLFQTSAKLRDADDSWVVADGDWSFAKESAVDHMLTAPDFFKYGPGVLAVCNDRDLCNSANHHISPTLLFAMIPFLTAFFAF